MFSPSECFTILKLGEEYPCLNVAGCRNSFSILCRSDLPAAKSPSLPPSLRPLYPLLYPSVCMHYIQRQPGRQGRLRTHPPLLSSLPSSSFLCLSKPSPPSPRGPFRLRRKCHLWRTGVALLPNIISHGRESLRLTFNLFI